MNQTFSPASAPQIHELYALICFLCLYPAEFSGKILALLVKHGKNFMIAGVSPE
jgi:hypothetical protein